MRKTTIDEAIARVDDWKGKEISYKPVSGGITNPNFKVDVEGEHFFLKIPGAGTDYINREVCHEANVIADESKAGGQMQNTFTRNPCGTIRKLHRRPATPFPGCC